MRQFLTSAGLSLAALLLAGPAFAGNVAKCEVVALLTVEDEAGGSASYRYYFPASDFLSGVYDPDVEITREQDGHPIEGITCERKTLMPDEEDYAILATGIPMVLSQDFDQPDTDVLTLFFANDAFRYRFLSEQEMDAEFETSLEALLADFTIRDHGLGVAAIDKSTEVEIDADDMEVPETEIVAESVELEESPDDVSDIEIVEMDETAMDPAVSALNEDGIPVGSILTPEAQTVTEPVADTEPDVVEVDDPEEVSSVTDLVFDPETGELVKVTADD